MADGWQDISTAPKDGTPVLLYSPEAAGKGRWVGRYNSAPNWHCVKIGDKEMPPPKPNNPGTPTHWMPLPEPPSKLDQDRDAAQPVRSSRG